MGCYSSSSPANKNKARRRWWKDWARVGEGLDRDVRNALDEVIQNQVFAVPRTACNGLEELISKRRKELDAMEDDLQRLSAESANARERRRRAARRLVEAGHGPTWIAEQLGVTKQAVDGFLRYEERKGR